MQKQKSEPGNIPSTIVDGIVKEPILLYGVDLDTLENIALNYHANTKIKDKNGKEKKLRKDANVILAGVISLNRDNENIWDDYKNDSIKYLKEKYGDKLKSVIENIQTKQIHIFTFTLSKMSVRFLILFMMEKKQLLKFVHKTEQRENRTQLI